MGLLDKLKPQPRWKHADPAVRLEAVRELEDPIELATLAEADADAKVRRAAIARIADATVLGRVANGHQDTDTRDRAAERLVALAVSAETDPHVAVAAVNQLPDARQLSTIAKSEAPDAVRAAALARTTDERALGAIARHAARESTAAAALDRLSDAGEVIDTVLNADHKDVALTAFDRFIAPQRDLAQLRSIEARAQQKVVAKRARAVIQEIEDAEAARKTAEEERRRREAAVVADVERLVEIADINAATSEFDRLSASWQSLQVTDEGSRAKFDAAAQAVRDAIIRRRREADEAAERARVRAEALASREALCGRVETLAGDHILEHLAPIEEEWRSLTPLVGNGAEADRLAERFAVAVTACRKRHELRAVLDETRAKLEALVVEAEGLLSRDDVATAESRWHAISREARGLTAVLADGSLPGQEPAAVEGQPGLVDRLSAVDQGFAAREAGRREVAAKAQRDLLTRIQRLTDRAKKTAEADTITLREGDRLMRDIGAALEEASKSATTREIDEAAGTLRTAQQAVAPRVRELRDMDEWRRFANAQQQEQLIAMAEAIVASLKADDEAHKEPDLPATAKALKELHAKWQEVADAPRQHAQRLWDRFRSATDFIRTRCESYFAKLRDELSGNLEKKTAIVEEAEALANSTDWGKTAGRFQELQNAWQATGPLPRHAARDLPQRFRAACNTFFARRRDDMLSRKKVWTDNLTRKEELCARAEALAESTEWDTASAEIKRLQAEWKTIGPVRRSQSEAIWARFRGAADKFFERFHHRHEITIATKLAEREALIAEMEAFAALAPEAVPADLAAQVDAVKVKWTRSVPIPGPAMTPLADRWRLALASVVERHPSAFQGSDLDPAVIMQRMQKLVTRVEALVSQMREPAETAQSQTEALAAKLRSAFATNAMGGRASEDQKLRAAAEAVKEAQTSWQRLAIPQTAEARALENKFKDACRRVNDHARRQSGPSGSPRSQQKRTAAAVS